MKRWLITELIRNVRFCSKYEPGGDKVGFLLYICCVCIYHYQERPAFEVVDVIKKSHLMFPIFHSRGWCLFCKVMMIRLALIRKNFLLVTFWFLLFVYWQLLSRPPFADWHSLGGRTMFCHCFCWLTFTSSITDATPTMCYK